MIVLGCDHGGLNLKAYIENYLTEQKIEFKDVGTFSSESCDYPDIAEKAAKKITSGECDLGILICGTGIGMSIAANKTKGIRAAHATDTYSAKMAKEHNNAQILCLGERITGLDLGLEIAKAFLSSSFCGGRHEKRVEKIMNLEK